MCGQSAKYLLKMFFFILLLVSTCTLFTLAYVYNDTNCVIGGFGALSFATIFMCIFLNTETDSTYTDLTDIPDNATRIVL